MRRCFNRKLLCFTLALFFAITFFARGNVSFAAENVALGKPAYASGYYDATTTIASKVTNGNYNDYFASGAFTNGPGAIGKIKGQNFVAVDLEGYYTIDQIIVRSTRSADGIPESYRMGWNICVANDLYGEWVKVGERAIAGDHGSDTDISPRGLKIPYRYVLIWKEQMFLIGDIEVYGAETDYDPNAKQPLEDTPGTEFEEAVEVLMHLGIMEPVEETLFQPYWAITRGAAVESALKLIGVREYAGGEQIFADVPPEHDKYAAINTASRMKISDPGGAYFRPDDLVTAMEFSKLIMYAIGYNRPIETSGGWTTGIIFQSKRLELLKNVKAELNGQVSRADAAQMLYNALTVEVFANTYDPLWLSRNSTVLESVYRLNRIEGVVTANAVTNFIRAHTERADYTEIDTIAYKDTTGKLSSLLGQQVRCLVNEENEILIVFTTGRSIVTTLTGEYVAANGARAIEYTEGDRVRQYRLASDVVVIKNGVAAKGWTIDDLAAPYGWMDLVSSDGSGLVNLVMLYSPKVVVISAVNVIDDKSFDIFGINGESRQYSGLERITVVNGGIKRALSALTLMDLAYICESEDGKSVYIEFVRDGFKDVADEISSDGVTLGGRRYEFSRYYTDYMQSTGTNPGKFFNRSATYVLDRYGKIAFIDDSSKINMGEMFGFIVSVQADSGSIGGKLMLRIFGQDGKFYILSSSEKVIVDGRRITKADAVALGSAYFLHKPCLIRFSGDTLTFIDTPVYNAAAEPDSVMIEMRRQSFSGDGHIYSGALSIIMNRGNMYMPVRSATPSFVIPRSGGEPYYDESFKKYYTASPNASGALGGTSQLSTFNDEYAFYGNDPQFGYPSLIVAYKNYSTAGGGTAPPLALNENTAMVVDRINQAIVGEERIIKIYGYNLSDFSEVSLTVQSETTACYDTFRTQQEHRSWHNADGVLNEGSVDATIANYITSISDIKRGDVLGYAVRNGQVSALERLFSVDMGSSLRSEYAGNNGNFYAKGSVTGGYMVAPLRLFYGTVLTVNRDVAILEKMNIAGAVSTEQHLYKNVKNLYILKEDKLIKSSPDALASYAGSTTDGILMYNTGGNLTTIIVYEY